MSIAVKVCGVSTVEAIETASAGRADYLGFVFYPRSPRYVTPEQAARLVMDVPRVIQKVGLFVDAEDQIIEHCLGVTSLDMLQLHGDETADRCGYIRRRFGRPVMKAIKVSTAKDIEAVHLYIGSVDWLVFDARPPESTQSLPGGNGVAFDWSLLRGRNWPVPWMLSGGLNADNIATALRISGAETVDVSSGVENSPGIKDPGLIRDFLAKAKSLS